MNGLPMGGLPQFVRILAQSVCTCNPARTRGSTVIATYVHMNSLFGAGNYLAGECADKVGRIDQPSNQPLRLSTGKLAKNSQSPSILEKWANYS